MRVKWLKTPRVLPICHVPSMYVYNELLSGKPGFKWKSPALKKKRHTVKWHHGQGAVVREAQATTCRHQGVQAPHIKDYAISVIITRSD